MKKFSDKGIQLINEKFELSDEGIKFLEELSDKNLSIISIIGPKSSGKSFLANQLLDKFNKGFSIGSMNNTSECCTKGIWVWGNPIIKNDYYILILDVQGFQNETEEQILYSQKLFALSNLISSIIIYNYKRDDGSEEENEISEEVIKNAYELFNKLLPFLSKIKLVNDGSINEELNKITFDFIPNYYWLYRDYDKINFDQYKEKIESLVKDQILYNDLFKNKIKKYSLPFPMDENEMLINVYLDEEDDGKGGPFEEEYKKQFNIFKNEIMSKISPKVVGGMTITGELLNAELQEYTHSLASNELVIINSPINKIKQNELNQINTKVTENCKTNIEEKNKNIIDIISKTQNSYEILSKEILNGYESSSAQNIIKQISENINYMGKLLIDNDIKNNISRFDDSLKELIDKKEKISIQSNIEKKEDIKDNINKFINEIKIDLNEIIFNEKNLFLSSFILIKDYIDKCVYNKIDNYIDNINIFFDKAMKNNQELLNKSEELDKRNSEIKELQKRLEDLQNEINIKEKNYNKNLQIEKDKYNQLIEENNTMIAQKENLIKQLEEKCDEDNKKAINIQEEMKKNIDSKQIEIDSINKKFNNLENKFKNLGLEKENIEKELQELKNKEPQKIDLKDEDLPKLKDLFKEFENSIKEYSETVNNLQKNKSIITKNKFIEESKSSLDDTTKNWIEELKKTKESYDNAKNSNFSEELIKLREENNKLNGEITKLNEDNSKKENEIKKLKEELDLEKEISIGKDKAKETSENLIKTLKSTNELYEQTIKENKKNIDDMEVKLSTNITNLYIKEDEIEMTLSIFKSMCEKNKKVYELNLKKLPKELRAEIEAINRKYKFIK